MGKTHSTTGRVGWHRSGLQVSFPNQRYDFEIHGRENDVQRKGSNIVMLIVTLFSRKRGKDRTVRMYNLHLEIFFFFLNKLVLRGGKVEKVYVKKIELKNYKNAKGSGLLALIEPPFRERCLHA